MIPLIERDIVERNSWIDKKGFIDLLAVAQAAPGVFAVNISTFIGHKLRGLRGAVAAAVGAAAIGCFVGMFFMLGRPVTAMVTLGASLLCAGIGILMILLSNLAAKGMIALTKLCWQGVKSILQRKEKTI